MMQQHLMNGIMRDMRSMLELDNLFQSSCAQILLFVDFKYQLNGLFIQGLFLSSKFLNNLVHLGFRPVHPDTFQEDGLNFRSCAILLVLSPLFLDRMIYLIFLSVSFTTLFFFPMPNWWVYKVKGFGTTQNNKSAKNLIYWQEC
jgi:hypothetical protein